MEGGIKLNIQELHENILYPCCRVRMGNSGGSGTVIYSQPVRNKDDADEYQTFVLTNYHVVESAITTKEDWDGLLQKKTRKEVKSKVAVDIFSYVDMSTIVSSNTHQADIVAYDKTHDLALLKLNTPKKLDFVAKLYPRGDEDKIKMFMKIFACGASLLHDPFANSGYITYLQEYIDNELFFMSNANMIFGNSGGAVFLEDSGEFIGVPARVTVKEIGFGQDIITWMGFFIPIQRVYRFLAEQEMQFIFADDDSFEAGLSRREARLKKLSVDIVKEEESQGQIAIPGYPVTEYKV